MNINPQLNRASLKKLPGIYTLTDEQVGTLLGRMDENDCALLEETMEGITSTETPRMNNREWLHNTLSNVPAHNWVCDGGVWTLKPTKGASLKMLNRTGMTATEKRQWQDRKTLCTHLFQALSTEAQAAWGPMLGWTNLQLPDPAYEHYEDLALYRTIIDVNTMFNYHYGLAERELNHSATEPLPFPAMRVAADRAQKSVMAELEKAFGLEYDLPEQWPQSLDDVLTRALCSIAANHDLLETSAVAQMADIGLRMILPLTQALEAAGITETPEIRSEDEIEEKLLLWFGPQGMLSGIANYERTLQRKDLQEVLVRTQEIRTAYINRRRLNFSDAMIETLMSLDCLFCFALMIVAAFYSQTRVPKEFLGDKNSSYALFPPAQGNARNNPLPPHALEIYMASFGQYFFSMPPRWGVSSASLKGYSDSMVYKRSRCQELVFRLFKRTPPSQILQLHQGIEKIMAG